MQLRFGHVVRREAVWGGVVSGGGRKGAGMSAYGDVDTPAEEVQTRAWRCLQRRMQEHDVILPVTHVMNICLSVKNIQIQKQPEIKHKKEASLRKSCLEGVAGVVAKGTRLHHVSRKKTHELAEHVALDCCNVLCLKADWVIQIGHKPCVLHAKIEARATHVELDTADSTRVQQADLYKATKK